MSDLIEKNARHTPCENCREHRRKCSVPIGTNCERCQRMNLVCLFKYTKTPKGPKAPTSLIDNVRKKHTMRKKHYLAAQVRQLQIQVKAMEAELQALRQDCHATPIYTISSKNGNILRLETSVRNMADMIDFLKGTYWYFFRDIGPIPWFYPSPSADTLLAVAKRIQPLDRIMRIFYDATNSLAVSPTSFIANIVPELHDTNPAITQLKRRIIHTYFSCSLYSTPVLVQPYFLDYLLKDPHSMLANAVVTFSLHAPCEHVTMTLPNLRRDVFAAMMFEMTYGQLRDAMFEDESLDTILTMWYIATCLITNLKIDEGRGLINLAWRTALHLKDTYVPILKKSEWDDPVALARAETWRRLFYQIRYVEMNMMVMWGNNPDFYQFIDASKHIGCPIVLPSEKVDLPLSRAVDIYGYLVTLSMLPGGFDKTTHEDIVALNIYASNVDSVSQAEIAVIEQRLIEFWSSLPRSFVLDDQPIMSILDMDRIRECNLPSVLYLNMMYYLYWIILQMRLMSPPETADLTGASLDRLDGDHALVIVSICCDAVAKIALVVNEKKPCANDTHWMMAIAYLLLLLKKAANATIRTRAEQNLQWVMVVLNNAVVQFDQAPTSPLIPSTYYGEIKVIMAEDFLNRVRR